MYVNGRDKKLETPPINHDVNNEHIVEITELNIMVFMKIDSIVRLH